MASRIGAGKGVRWNAHTFRSLTTRELIVIGRFAAPLPDGAPIEGLFEAGNMNVRTSEKKMTFGALLHLSAPSLAKCFDVSLCVNNLNLHSSRIYRCSICRQRQISPSYQQRWGFIARLCCLSERSGLWNIYGYLPQTVFKAEAIAVAANVNFWTRWNKQTGVWTATCRCYLSRRAGWRRKNKRYTNTHTHTHRGIWQLELHCAGIN